MSKISDEIKKIFKENKYNVTSVGLGKKITNSVKTDEVCITFGVAKKTNEIPEEQKIPDTISIDGALYKTDVVASPYKVKALTCFDPVTPPEDIMKLRRVQLTAESVAENIPIKGGQQLMLYPDEWYGAQYSEPVTGYASGDYLAAVGTLGFLCIDDIDGKVVGLTNLHVASPSRLENTDRDLYREAIDPYCFTEQRAYTSSLTDITHVGLPNHFCAVLHDVANDAYQPFSLGHTNTINKSGGSSTQAVCDIKRASWFDSDTDNEIDVAVLQINNLTNVDINGDPIWSSGSYRISQPSGTTPITDYLDFATTEELDNLITNPPTHVYSTGRTTGPKGWGNTPDCQLEIVQINSSANVEFGDRDLEKSVPFHNCFRIGYVDNSNFPTAGGDSGSCVFAEMPNGQHKILGLVFAGNGGKLDNPNNTTHYGLCCRIDKIASAMNVRAWTETDTLNGLDFSASTINSLTRAYTPDDASDKTSTFNTAIAHYNAGLKKKTST
tara:strand:- start:5160 stop:6650 length:1491 start_codon:yes stop_codon:yes gene_type:complete